MLCDLCVFGGRTRSMIAMILVSLSADLPAAGARCRTNKCVMTGQHHSHSSIYAARHDAMLMSRLIAEIHADETDRRDFKMLENRGWPTG